ncbi:hypothetical protein Micbo1qcDRAFT_205079 [Microdochium bolleyi]|uniref:Uncharacterized protein n=1 Tax=Microdochium bolleyi TaxID=196109 RepID=A0A136J1U7_9PEZI|nr:hypothetical protein Micbo1qcDRAFT_205079 [Microdochium bolleyi]
MATIAALLTTEASALPTYSKIVNSTTVARSPMTTSTATTIQQLDSRGLEAGWAAPVEPAAVKPDVVAVHELMYHINCFPETGQLNHAETDVVLNKLRKYVYQTRAGKAAYTEGSTTAVSCTATDGTWYGVPHLERAILEMDLLCGPYVASRFTYTDIGLVIAKGTGSSAPATNCMGLGLPAARRG